VANGRYGKEIDIYALGIILYEMLTGQVPFEGESIGEVLMKHLTAEPSLDKLPDGYRQVVARALAKDPTTRFASVGEMVHALPPMAATMAYRPPVPETRYPQEQPAAKPVEAAYAAASVEPIMAQFVAGAAGAAKTVVDDDDPVWNAVRDGWRNARDSWDRLNMPTKIAVAVIG
jgi:serine/threonine protein kinase